jgi:hypothetical protein
VRLRAQALAWLRDELTRWAGQFAANSKGIRLALRLWQHDVHLACVRDPGQLARLPPPEREGRNQFWADVARIAEHGPKAP